MLPVLRALFQLEWSRILVEEELIMMKKWSLINASDLSVMETNKLTIQNRYTDFSFLFLKSCSSLTMRLLASSCTFSGPKFISVNLPALSYFCTERPWVEDQLHINSTNSGLGSYCDTGPENNKCVLFA